MLLNSLVLIIIYIIIYCDLHFIIVGWVFHIYRKNADSKEIYPIVCILFSMKFDKMFSLSKINKMHLYIYIFQLWNCVYIS